VVFAADDEAEPFERSGKRFRRVLPNGTQQWLATDKPLESALMNFSVQVPQPDTFFDTETDMYLHRGNDLPAVITSDNTQRWFHIGMLMRHDESLPTVLRADGTKEWRMCDPFMHRRKSDDTEGVLHRHFGPAIMRPNGDVEYRRHA
jgi:hypothetical protein